jgi:hypothetical protein
MAVEYCDSNCYHSRSNNAEPVIYGQHLEQHIVSSYHDAMSRYRSQGVTDAIYIGFSLVGIANKRFYASLGSLWDQMPIVVNTFNSPEVFVDINEPEDHPYRKTLLPLVDTMWQVAGRPGTPFRPNSEWQPFASY